MFKVDCIVVHGHRVLPDGALSEESKTRIEKGLELYKMKIAPQVIFTGGKVEALSEPMAEAEAMASYAIKKGLPEKAILKELKSLDTVGNACYLKKSFLIPRGWKTLFVITSEYHIPRASFIYNFVLGKNYIAYFAPAYPNLSEEELLELEKKELNSMSDTLKFWLDAGIKRGQHDAILNLLLQTHPRYKQCK